MFVPESHKWEKEQAKGATSHWATQDLLGVLVGLAGPALIVAVWAWPVKEADVTPSWRITQIACTLLGLVIATAGYTYPVVRYFQRQAASGMGGGRWSGTFGRMLLAAALSGVALLGTWGSTQQAPSWADKLTEAEFNKAKQTLVDAGQQAEADALKRPSLKAKERTLIWLSIGAIIGTIGAALMGDWIGRRPAYFLLCILSLLSAWVLFLGNKQFGTGLLVWSLIAGAFTASFYGWLPLYLPELFPTSMRATGQGFGFNFGRILAAIGVLQVGNLLKSLTTDLDLSFITIPAGHPVACSAISLVYVVGMIIIWFAPETRGKPLPE